MSSAAEAATCSAVQFWPSSSRTRGLPSSRLTRLTCRTLRSRSRRASVSGLSRYPTTIGSWARASSSATEPEAAIAAALAANASYLISGRRMTIGIPGQRCTAPSTAAAPCPDHRGDIMDQRQGLAMTAQAMSDAPTEPRTVDGHDGVGPQGADRGHRFAYPPQDRRRLRQYLGDAGDSEIGKRNKARG